MMPVRNEDWILPLSIPGVMSWCDALVVLLHRCVDDSKVIVQVARANYGTDRVMILESEDESWHEMIHRQRMLDAARTMGATHLAITDADEVLVQPNSIKPMIAGLAAGHMLQLPMRNVWRRFNQYRSDRSPFGQAVTTLAFADHHSLGWRNTNGDYCHHHREPFNGRVGLRVYDVPGVLHLQFVDWARLTAKHAWYKMQERARWPHKPVAEIDRLYSMALDETGFQGSPIPDGWWSGLTEFFEFVKIGAPSWHIAECARLKAAYPRGYFNGLNLWGVA